MAYDDDSMYETDEHPMVEVMYNTLACVRRFTERNGSTYTAYCAAWTERYELAIETTARLISGMSLDRTLQKREARWMGSWGWRESTCSKRGYRLE